MADSPSIRHWQSARDLLVRMPPSDDDIPITASGEPLDSSEKVRQFVEQLNAGRIDAKSDVG